MNSQPFTLEKTYNSPIGKVWKAITDKNEMKKWYFDLPDFKAEVGTEFQFKGGPDDGKQYLHLCKVVEVKPESKIAYTWKYDGYEGSSKVVFELFEEGNQTRLKLTHEGLETFPSDNPDLAKENFAAGWTEIIGNSLTNFLAK